MPPKNPSGKNEYGSRRWAKGSVKLPPLPYSDETVLPRAATERRGPVARLIGASAHRGDAGLDSVHLVVERLRQHPEILEPILEAYRATIPTGGRPRGNGDWPLAYLGAVASKHVQWKAFYNSHKRDTSFWKTCGFVDDNGHVQLPSYPLVARRFAELDQNADAFQDAAGKLIQRARRHTGGLIGRHVMVDGTQAQANARLEHACRDGECDGFGTLPDGRSKRPKPVTQTASKEDVEEDRSRLASLPVAYDGALLGDMDPSRVRIDVLTGRVEFRPGKSKHWWTCSDQDASVRSYFRNGGKTKSWIGFTNVKAIDAFTNLPIAVLNETARVNEHLVYPRVLEALLYNLGAVPVVVAGDRAYDAASVRRLNAEHHLIATVTHRRSPRVDKYGDPVERADTPEWDRDGVPRCVKCGGPAEIIGMTPAGEHPSGAFRPAYIRVVCRHPQTPACRKEQKRQMGGKKGDQWPYVNLLAADEETHQVLNRIHNDHENPHERWRDAYGVAGDNKGTRIHRRGLAAQNLRSQAALLIDWLRTCNFQGWLGSGRRAERDLRKQPFFLSGRAYLAKAAKRRTELRLDMPYGTIAEHLNLGPQVPDLRDEKGNIIPWEPDPRWAPGTPMPPEVDAVWEDEIKAQAKDLAQRKEQALKEKLRKAKARAKSAAAKRRPPDRT